MHLPFASIDISTGWPFLVAIAAMAVPIVAIITNFFQRQHLLRAWHHQRMAAIEKGIELPTIPPELSAAFSEGSCESAKKPEHYLLTGLILIAVGAGVVVLLHMMRHMTGIDFAAVGVIPGLIGVAFVLYYLATKGKQPSA